MLQPSFSVEAAARVVRGSVELYFLRNSSFSLARFRYGSDNLGDTQASQLNACLVIFLMRLYGNVIIHTIILFLLYQAICYLYYVVLHYVSD